MSLFCNKTTGEGSTKPEFNFQFGSSDRLRFKTVVNLFDGLV